MSETDARLEAVRLWMEKTGSVPYHPSDFKKINDIAEYLLVGKIPDPTPRPVDTPLQEAA